MLSQIYKLYTFYYRVKVKIVNCIIKSSFARFGNHTSIETPFRIEGQKDITIGNNTFIGADSWLASWPENTEGTPTIEIGDDCSFSGHCTITSKSCVKIGKSVLIARYVYISDHSHNYKDSPVPVKDQGTTAPKPVFIEDGAWIAQGAVICPGVTIGSNSVVAANAVVNSDVPPNSVAAGIPAKIVKRFKEA